MTSYEPKRCSSMSALKWKDNQVFPSILELQGQSSSVATTDTSGLRLKSQQSFNVSQTNSNLEGTQLDACGSEIDIDRNMSFGANNPYGVYQSEKSKRNRKQKKCVCILSLGLFCTFMIMGITFAFLTSKADQDNCFISNGAECDNNSEMVQIVGSDHTGWDPQYDQLFEEILDIYFGRDNISWFNQINETEFYQDAFITTADVCQLKTFDWIKATPEVVYQNTVDFDIRAKWDTQLYDLKYYYRSPDHSYARLSYAFDSPYPVYDRDFYLQQLIRRDYPEPGWITIVVHSLPLYDKEYPINSDRVRAECLQLGNVIRPLYDMNSDEDPLTEIFVTSLIDINGAIPKWMYNLAQRSIPIQWAQKFQEACETDQIRRDEAK